MTFDIELQGITIGALQIRFYSLMILSGMLAGIVLGRREARRLGEDPDHVLNIVALGAVFGLIGARLYHVFDQQEWPYYQANPEKIIAIWNGGIGIFGAIGGALAALFLYTWRRRLWTLRWLDIGAPAFLLAQAIGRWGNFFNQELFGPPTSLSWGIFIARENRPSLYADADRFHPLFLYESLLSVVGVAVLLYIGRRFGRRASEAKGEQGARASRWRLLPGDIVLLYFLWYPAERFALEFLRISPWSQGGTPTAQWISGALVLIAVGTLVWRHIRLDPDAEAGAMQPAKQSRAATRRKRRRMGENNPWRARVMARLGDCFHRVTAELLAQCGKQPEAKGLLLPGTEARLEGARDDG